MRNPPMLNSKITLALLLTICGSPAFAQEPAGKPQQEASSQPKQPTDESKTAVEVVAKAIKTLNGYASITAKVRETVEMGTRRFVANGSYVQGTDNQLRLEIEVGGFEQMAKKRVAKEQKTADVGKAAPKASDAKNRNAVLHVCDGRFLWTQWTTNGKSRIELRNVQEIGKEIAADEPKALKELMGTLGVGGVPGLVTALQNRMVFNSIAEKKIDGVEYIVVQGRWNAEQVRVMLMQGQATPQEMQAIMQGQMPLPRYLPEYARLFFEKKTMFPRRIMFLKQPQPNAPQARPMVTMDFSEVGLNGDVDPVAFRFKPPTGKTPDDITQKIIQALKAQKQQLQNQPLGPVKGAAGQ